MGVEPMPTGPKRKHVATFSSRPFIIVCFVHPLATLPVATARPRALSVDPSRERRSFQFLDASSLSDTLEQSPLEAFVTPRRAFPNPSGSTRFFSPAS